MLFKHRIYLCKLGQVNQARWRILSKYVCFGRVRPIYCPKCWPLFEKTKDTRIKCRPTRHNPFATVPLALSLSPAPIFLTSLPPITHWFHKTKKHSPNLVVCVCHVKCNFRDQTAVSSTYLNGERSTDVILLSWNLTPAVRTDQ